ncbi:MAG: LytR C-terminal domain-containing protein, partial [Solirubrobacterales bacterium]|nr:LytR C-terminal domain-containing protein [Solirubrobacterales bacterium]
VAPGPPAGVATVAPGPPAGVAAPALAAATRLIPAVSAPSQLASPATSAVAAPPPTGAGAAPLASPPPRSASGPASAYAAAPGDGATLAAPPPPTTAAGGAGGANGDVRDRVYGGAAGRPMLPPPAQREARRPWSGRVFAALLAALVVAGIVVALLIVTSNSGTNSATSSAQATNASAAHKAKRSTTFRPSSVTVAVLNGTGVAGLARRVATRLVTAGYKQGTVTNASDQTHTATVIAYLPNHRNDALKVASSLKLGPGAVQPVDAGTQQVACPPGMTCAADVVVTVGTDLASQP